MYCEYQDIIESSAEETKGSGGDKMRWNKDRNIDEYIAGFPENIQEKIKRIRQVIKESAPGAREAISYGMPTYKLNGNLVHFAAFKDHIGFFPTPTGVSAFKKELSLYGTSKGTIRFPLDKPIPFELIKKIVKFRVSEASGKDKSEGAK
jgi:uncharacterized protein YdhG (YjbR/CyaY superfamily)